MSVHSNEELMIPMSDSFWEPQNYRRTTKRIEDGYKLSNDLIALVQERSDIEKAYAKSLKGWAKKWNEIIEKGPEYGTTEAGWKGALVEAERLSDVHNRIKDDLCNDVIQQIKTWQKNTYHKTVLHLKERKNMEDAFRKAQKPWWKLLNNVNTCKCSYYTACKGEHSALNLEKNALADTALSSDQVKKIQDRVQRAKDEAEKAKEKYLNAIKELDSYNPKYMEDMSTVFDKCQEMEGQRLQFFKDVLFGVHKILNLSQDPVIPQIYEEFYHTINNADFEKDLKWWSNNHGVNMAMNWPTYEEYKEEFRDISKGKIKDSIPAGSITLTNQRPLNEDMPDNDFNKYRVNSKKVSRPNSTSNQPVVNNTEKSKKFAYGDGNVANAAADEKPQKNGPTSPSRAAITNGNQKDDSNPFDEDDWEDTNDALIDNGEPGVPVRALYDYEGTEGDELSFKQGEMFEKLEDEDEQGWCKGRKDGRVGLYPANYVEPVA